MFSLSLELGWAYMACVLSFSRRPPARSHVSPPRVVAGGERALRVLPGKLHARRRLLSQASRPDHLYTSARPYDHVCAHPSSALSLRSFHVHVLQRRRPPQRARTSDVPSKVHSPPSLLDVRNSYSISSMRSMPAGLFSPCAAAPPPSAWEASCEKPPPSAAAASIIIILGGGAASWEAGAVEKRCGSSARLVPEGSQPRGSSSSAVK